MIIDVDALRNDLINYFGTALFYNPNAMMELIEVEKASDEQIVQIAIQKGFDINMYDVNNRKR